VRGKVYGPVDCLEDIRFQELTLAQHSNACSIAIKKFAMLSQLNELDACHIHERIDFIFRSLEILNAERVYCHDFDAGFVANFEDLITAVRNLDSN
jgi:hypothetical protein